MKEIKICLGSSCFSRGNHHLVKTIQEYLAQKDLTSKVNLVGTICAGSCEVGPNLFIDGKLYKGVDDSLALKILEELS
jgi:NADH:ubiquinone oxidoreductase subunit E